MSNQETEDVLSFQLGILDCTQRWETKQPGMVESTSELQPSATSWSL